MTMLYFITGLTQLNCPGYRWNGKRTRLCLVYANEILVTDDRWFCLLDELIR